MTDFVVPSVSEAVFTAGQVSQILARPRPTVTGWISAYPWLGIDPVTPGSTRRFSCRDIGLLTTLRLALTAGKMTDAICNTIDLIEPEIHAEFALLFEQMHLDEWGNAGEIRPRLPIVETPLVLISRGYLGSEGEFLPRRSENMKLVELSYIADLAGFQLPETILPLGQGLRNAWTRALHVLNGFALEG